MLKKNKAMKSAVAMLAAMSMVSSLAFAAGTKDGSESRVDAGALHIVDQGDAPVGIGSHKTAVNVVSSKGGYTPASGTDAAGNKVDATTGASILVTDSTSSLVQAHNKTEEDAAEDVYSINKNKAKVVVSGERTVMGLGTQGTSTGTGFGAYANAKGKYSVAVGDGVLSDGVNSTAVGSATRASGFKSAAFGFGAQATAENALAIGSDAKATGKDSVAIGAGSVATKDGEISLGNASSGVYNKMTNLGDAELSANSRDAVTGRQLYKTNQEVDNVGALSAALAGLHPLDYDGTGSKVSVATAVGNYDGKKALAVGGFYNFSPDAMMSLGASMSFSGDKKYAENLGFTFRVGEGASTAPAGHHDEMADRFVAMEQAIAELKAQNEALTKQVTAVEQENKDLKAKVDTLQK